MQKGLESVYCSPEKTSSFMLRKLRELSQRVYGVMDRKEIGTRLKIFCDDAITLLKIARPHAPLPDGLTRAMVIGDDMVRKPILIAIAATFINEAFSHGFFMFDQFENNAHVDQSYTLRIETLSKQLKVAQGDLNMRDAKIQIYVLKIVN